MTPQDAGRQVLTRLLRVNWNDERAFEHRESRRLLMREYLRRTARWAHAVEATNQWPFFDIAAHINPSVRAAPELVRSLEEFIVNEIGHPAVQATCRGALHWAVLTATPGQHLPNFADPFDPLLVMYERGGSFTIEHDFIDLDLSTVPLRKWQYYLDVEPLASLESKDLDSIDEHQR